MLLGGDAIGLRLLPVFFSFHLHSLVRDGGLTKDLHRSRHGTDFVGTVGKRNLRTGIALGQSPHRGCNLGNGIGNARQHEGDRTDNEQSGEADRSKQIEFDRRVSRPARFGGLFAADDIQFDQGRR